MSSSHPNFDSTNSETLQGSNHKKRRKISDRNNSLRLTPWRSETEQRIYSSKLVDALRHVLRRASTPPVAKPNTSREVREVANRVLAARGKGRTRWSRAILASPLSQWKLQKLHKKVRKASPGRLANRSPDTCRSLPTVQKKARVLGRLVPGCRKLSFPNLLEEATDYISALEMQVRTMTSLAELLTGSSCAPPVARS